MNSIGQLIQKGELSHLTAQALRLKKLQSLLQNTLPPELCEHTRAVALMQNCLLLEVSNSSTATMLRYYTPSLLSELRKSPEFASIVSIKQQVKPLEIAKKEKQKPKREPYSANTSSLLAQIASKISYEPLKQALLKLSAHLPK